MNEIIDNNFIINQGSNVKLLCKNGNISLIILSGCFGDFCKNIFIYCFFTEEFI